MTTSTPKPTMAMARFEAIDAMRGLAVVWMTVYHFSFDLDHFGFIQQSLLTDPFWTTQRSAIVSLFLFTAGLGQAIALGQGQGWPRFWRRWVQVAGCALLVSVGSWWMFAQSYIYFGVLHGLAAMLIVARLTAGWGRWLWPLGALAIAMPSIASWAHSTWASADLTAMFDSRALNWLGWVSHKPVTEDYVPVFPWLGVLWWGLAAGMWLVRQRPAWLATRVPGPARWLALLGRWSLTWYMLHQPVLMGVLMALAAWR
jgi:uncharacterized membrane protein